MLEGSIANAKPLTYPAQRPPDVIGRRGATRRSAAVGFAAGGDTTTCRGDLD